MRAETVPMLEQCPALFLILVKWINEWVRRHFIWTLDDRENFIFIFITLELKLNSSFNHEHRKQITVKFSVFVTVTEITGIFRSQYSSMYLKYSFTLINTSNYSRYFVTSKYLHLNVNKETFFSNYFIIIENTITSQLIVFENNWFPLKSCGFIFCIQNIKL